MSKKLAKAILRLRPDAQFVIRGDDVEWHSQDIAQPTKEELKASLLVIDNEAYKDLRAAEYPSIGDQLDALWKGGDAAAEMFAKVQAVKTKYPKSNQGT